MTKMLINIHGTATLGLPNGKVISVDPTDLDFLGYTGGDRQMGYENIHNYSFTDENGNKFIWEVSEYPEGVLNFLNHDSGNFVLIEDFIFSLEQEPESQDEYENAIREMVEWFYENFQDPANRLPYDSRNGGYQWIHGGPYDAYEEISDHFSSIYSERAVEAAAEEVTLEGTLDWDSTKWDDPDLSDYDELDDDWDENEVQGDTPNAPLDNFPLQERGFNFGIENGKVVYRPSYIDANSMTARLHKSLVDVTRTLQESHRTIGNKYRSLLTAIDEYLVAINKDISLVDAVEVYAIGLDLDTEFKVALEYSGDDLGEYPELNRNEKSAIEKVLRRHAAYIQSTPEGAYFTDAEERHLRSFEEEKHHSEAVKNAASHILNNSEIADPEAIQLIYDNAVPAENDPNASRKKTISRVGLRNFLIVAGIGTAVACGGTGAAVGIAVGSVFPSMGAAAGTFTAAGTAWVSKRIIQETKAFKDFTKASASKIDDWLESERPKLRPLAKFFRNSWEVFSPTIGSAGIDKWFEEIHRESAIKEKDAASSYYYEDEILSLVGSVDRKALKGVVTYCGIALHTRDGVLVACSDEQERNTIAKRYGGKKLGLEHGQAVALVNSICNTLKHVRFKNRVTIYYLMAEKINKLKLFH